MSVGMVSLSDVVFDGRVQRAAEAIAGAGHYVTVHGFTRESAIPECIQSDNPRYCLFNLDDAGGKVRNTCQQARFFFWIARRLLSSHFDVIHMHEPLLLPLAWYLSRVGGAKIIYDVRELYRSRFGRRSLMERVERSWQRSCHAFSIPSDERKALFTEIYPLHGRPIAVVRNLPRKEETLRRLIDEFPGNGTMLNCIYHGRISCANRHLEEMILAFAGLQAHLCIMGSDSQGTLQRLKDLASDRDIANVSFHDPCLPQHLISICRGLDVGLMPYRTVDLNTQLANPTKLAEYAGAGLALLGSRFPLLEDTILAYGAGRVIEFSDPKKIHYTLEGLLANRDAVQEMQDGALRWYREHGDWKLESHRYVDLYTQLR